MKDMKDMKDVKDMKDIKKYLMREIRLSLLKKN